MTPDQILNLLRAQPFVPFRLRLNSGAYHDVPHPEFATVSDEVVALSVYDEQKSMRTIHLVALINVEEVEHLKASA